MNLTRKWNFDNIEPQAKRAAARLDLEYAKMREVLASPHAPLTTAPPRVQDHKATARDRVTQAHNAYMAGESAIVHFSTGLFGKTSLDAVPVNHVVVHYRLNGSPQWNLFDSRQPYKQASDELRAILNCLQFFQGRPDFGIILWRNEHAFGFNHLARRLASLQGAEPEPTPAPARFFDLNQHLQDVFGHDYAPHPRFPRCIEMNKIEVANLLTAEQAADAFAAKNFEAMRMNSAAKCKAIAAILEKAANGELITGLVPPSPLEQTPAEPECAIRALLPVQKQAVLANGKTKTLGTAQFRVIQALRKAWPQRLTTAALTKESATDSPNKPLSDLRSDPDWAAILLFPKKEGHGVGYGIADSTRLPDSPRQTPNN